MISDFLAPVENEILKFKKDLPQASGNKVVNQAFINFYEGVKKRAY